jgi:hypothetical protein
MYAQGWEALREIRGPFYEDTYAEFMSIVRAAAAAPQVRNRISCLRLFPNLLSSVQHAVSQSAGDHAAGSCAHTTLLYKDCGR